MFTPGRLQDATPTIRGFIYQVQCTLLRWLDIEGDEQLVLECGEDIDHILAACDEDDRVLEQVKSRARGITLRSAEALVSLANFVEHLETNPGVALRFRYTTTASIGREKLPSPFRGEKGIEVWIRCQRTLASGEDARALLSQLVAVLTEARRPKKCSEATWQKLLAIVTGVGPIEFAEFVQRFEWSCKQESLGDLRESLIERIASLDGDPPADITSTTQRYDQLFARVLSILAGLDARTLTATTLRSALDEPTLAVADRKRLNGLEGLVDQHAERLEQLAEAVDRLGVAGIPPVLFGAEIEAIPDLDQSLVLRAPPPLVANLVGRTAVVTRIASDVRPPAWVSLYGSVGTGKSHLAQLVGRHLGGITIGATTRGLEGPVAERALAHLLAAPGIWAHLKEQHSPVVMIDDLPTVMSGSRLELTLQILGHSCSQCEAMLLTTGRLPLPATLTEAMQSSVLQEEVPSFSTEDARELLLAYGVRAELVDGNRAVVLNSACDGHPVLLSALARHLVATNAEPEQALLDAIGQVHRTDTDTSTMRTVLDSVEEGQCRELLYRLACANAPLSTAEIRSVAVIDPELSGTGECLARLEGIWLRRTDHDRLEISPLVKGLRTEVPAELATNVHRRVGQSIVQRRQIDLGEFYQAVNAFFLGRAPMSAAGILLLGYVKLAPKRLGYDAVGLLLYFPVEQPSGLVAAAELPIRTAQAVTAEVVGQDASTYIARLDELAKSDEEGMALARAQAGGMIIAAADVCSASLVTRAIGYLEDLRLASGRFAGVDWPPEDLPRDVHIVLATAAIRSWADLRLFVDALLALRQARRVEIMSSEDVREYCSVAIHRQLFNDALEVTPDAEQALLEIESLCAGQDMDAIGAMLASARLVIYGEYDKDISKVIVESEKARAEFGAEDIPRAIIDARVGQQLALAHRPGEALPLLKSAVTTDGTLGRLDRAFRIVDVLSVAIDLEAREDELAKELRKTLASGEVAHSTALCQLHGQLAVYYWCTDAHAESYRHLELCVEHWNTLEPSIRQKQLGAVLGHCLTYYASMLEDGKPPPKTADGGAFVAPHPRFFGNTSQEIAEGWRELTGPAMLRMQLGRIANMLGRAEDAKRWMEEAFEESVERGLPSFVSMTGPAAAIEALCAGDWESAIDHCLVHGRASVYCEKLRAEGIDSIGDDIQYDPHAPAPTVTEEERAESDARWLLSRAIAFSFCVIVPEGADRVEAATAGLSAAIMSVASKLHQSAAWLEFARVLALCGSPTSNPADIDGILGSEEDDVRFLAHSIAAFRSDAKLQQAVASQAGLIAAVCRLRIAFGTTRQEVFAAVSSNWDDVFSRARFAFRLPGRLEQTLVDAKDYPPPKRAAAVLRAVAESLDVDLRASETELLDQLIEADGRIPRPNMDNVR